MTFEINYVKVEAVEKDIDEAKYEKFWEWIEYFKERNRVPGDFHCQCHDCNNIAIKAPIVKRVEGELKNQTYLIPVCEKCQKKLEKQELYVWPSYLFLL